MIQPQKNPFGRTRYETATAEELLAGINRPMPFSDEAERGVISSWMRNPDLMEEDGVQPAAFYQDNLRTVAVEMMALKAAGKLVTSEYGMDVPLFSHHLNCKGLLDRVGGPSLLLDLHSFIPVPSHYAHYRAILTKCFKRRELMHRLLLGVDRLQQLDRNGLDEDLSSVVSEIHTNISDVETDDDSADLPARPIAHVINTVIEKTEYRASNPGVLPGIATGLQRLDELTGGLQPGRLWAVLAESSEGKSSLCRQIVEEACKQGHAGVIYTYEMMDDEEAGRMICSQGVVRSDVMKSGQFSRGELDGFQQACRDIKAWDISIVDVAGRYIEDIHRDIIRRKRRLKKGQELVVMIDYIQLALTRKECNSRQREIAHITGSTKQCAKRAKCTVLMPSQVNKDGEAREAMDIEQDADIELKVLKPEKNQKKERWKKDTQDEGDDRGKRLIKIAKNRDGPKNDSFPVRLVGQHFRFEQLQPEQAKFF